MVRIFGVPVNKEKTSKDIDDIVKKMITEHAVSEYSLNRTHRIGNTKKSVIDTENIETQRIMARYTIFGERTRFYRPRKTIKEASSYGMLLDLAYGELD